MSLIRHHAKKAQILTLNLVLGGLIGYLPPSDPLNLHNSEVTSVSTHLIEAWWDPVVCVVWTCRKKSVTSPGIE